MKLRNISDWVWCALLWLVALALILFTDVDFHNGWDLEIYQQAMKSLAGGLDPYAVGHQRQIAEHISGYVAYTYVYPPITTVILRILNYIPSLPGIILFWTIYAIGFGCQILAVFQLARPSERKLLLGMLPLAVFFPGFIPNDFLTVLSGNVAIPLYGAVWLAAVRGLKSERWGFFYVSVLAASLFKLPMLTLLAIPLLAGSAEFLKSTITAAIGVSQFLVQKLIWPKEFAEYLTNVQTQFTLNHDFGCSAAGVLGRSLDTHAIPFTTATTLFYLAYGTLIFAVLAKLASMYRQKHVEGKTCMTVLLLGTVMLNPRIMEYDALAFALPMSLLVIRGVRDRYHRRYLIAAAALAVCACLADQDYSGRLILMAMVFAIGVFGLMKEAQRSSFEPANEKIQPELAMTEESLVQL